MSDREPAKRPRGRPPLPREGQRQRLVDAAIRVFDRTNGEKLSVADIVSEAGMSSRTFYDHFDTKEDLVAEIFASQANRFIAELMEIARTTRGPVARADRALRAPTASSSPPRRSSTSSAWAAPRASACATSGAAAST